MADESDLERTEPASPRRLEQAREEGQVARSSELSTFAVLMTAGAGLWLTGSQIVGRLARLVEEGLQLSPDLAFDPQLMLTRLYQQASDALGALLPLLVPLFIAALVSPLLLNGWLLTPKALQPDFARMDPVKGLARMFSLRGVIELGKAVVKALLIGAVAAWVVWHNKEAVLGLATQSLDTGMAQLGYLVGSSFLMIAGALVLIVAADVPYQLWEHHRQLRMTRHELRQEAKETEGDPRVKARIRTLQRETARKRMMAEIPKADVVVTNPTHYAVALRYQDNVMRAPKLVAKGSRLLAGRIRQIAQEHRVPILEAPPLARALYHSTELGDEIPGELYTAVAEVLAYVYQLRRHQTHGGPSPHAPRDLPVPHHLDPESRSL